MLRVGAVKGQRRDVPVEKRGSSTTTPPPVSSVSAPGTVSGMPSSDVACDERRAGDRAPGRGANSLLLKPSRESGAKNESWNTVESCHSAVRSARREATALDSE